MATHFDNLLQRVPNLGSARILDIGSGRGGFLIDAARRGAAVQGLEYNPEYIAETRRRAEVAGVQVAVTLGAAESLPFADSSFDFVNLSEVIEHVQDPDAVLSEIRRVLVPGGKAYVSVPNRFAFIDPHFHLPLVNWLPRRFADTFITIFGKHKNYDGSAGKQRLSEMHYNTLLGATKLMARHGFGVQDIRALRIQNDFTGVRRRVAWVLYPFAQYLYFDSFHLLLTRT